MTTLLGALTRDTEAETWRSKDGRWAFGRMVHDRFWYVWEHDDDYPALGQRFTTLRDARDAVEQVLVGEAARS